MITTNVTKSISNTVSLTHCSSVTQISGLSPVVKGNFSIPKGPSRQQNLAPLGSSASDAVNIHKPTAQGNTGIDVCYCDC